jgi:hypothetical protein
MDGALMLEHGTEPKTYLGLDMDWITAAFAAFCFVLCLVTMVVKARHLLIGAPVQVPVTWDTGFLLMAFAWLAVLSRERITRFACGLLSIVFGSRVILWVVGASTQLQVLNSQVMRIVELVVMVGFCFYLVHWFRHRIKRV